MMLAALVAVCLPGLTAIAQTQTTLVVGATVLPHCRFSTEHGGQPAVTASCGAANLRALRVTTSRGEPLRPAMSRQLRAGGDAVFVITRDMISDGRTVLVTFDF